MVIKYSNSILARRMTAFRFSFALSLTLLTFSATNAAEFRYEIDRREQMLVFLEGPIERGDSEKLERILADALSVPFFNQLVLVLDSPGGSVSEAEKIGKLVRELLITTRTAAVAFMGWFDSVPFADGRKPELPWGGMRKIDGKLYREHPEAGRCWSACTIVFASGVIRQSVENFDKKNQFLYVPTIGVHRPKMPDEDFSELSPTAAQEAHSSMLRTMGDFLIEMGASREFVERTMATPSQDIDLVTTRDLEQMLPPIEPFFEDWIAARCGRKIDVLSPEEFSLYQRAPGKITYADWGFGYGETDTLHYDYTNYIDQSLRNQISEINRKVFEYNDFLHFCRIVTVKTHQTKWLNERRGK